MDSHGECHTSQLRQSAPSNAGLTFMWPSVFIFTDFCVPGKQAEFSASFIPLLYPRDVEIDSKSSRRELQHPGFVETYQMPLVTAFLFPHLTNR